MIRLHPTSDECFVKKKAEFEPEEQHNCIWNWNITALKSASLKIEWLSDCKAWCNEHSRLVTHYLPTTAYFFYTTAQCSLLTYMLVKSLNIEHISWLAEVRSSLRHLMHYVPTCAWCAHIVHHVVFTILAQARKENGSVKTCQMVLFFAKSTSIFKNKPQKVIWS